MKDIRAHLDKLQVQTAECEMIRDLGHRVIEAGSGAEALERLGEGIHVDVVVTDYKMPRMDGATLAKQVREMHPSMPVLIITGYTGISDEALNLPRLAKPFGQAEIAAALASLIVEDDNVVRFPTSAR